MNGIFDKTLLVSDFDGTLINSSGQISPENIRAVRYFTERGGLFCGATGRTQKNIGTHLDNLPVDAPWILYNGAAIYDFEAGTFLYTRPVDRLVLEGFIDQAISRFPQINVQVFTQSMLYLVNPEGAPDRQMLAEGQEHRSADMRAVSEDWLKVLFHADKDTLRAIGEMMDAHLEDRCFNWFYSAGHYLEITDAQVSKGDALQALRKLLGDKVRRIVAIGDYFNDVQMLQYADISAVPVNAPLEVRALADIITPSCDDHAIRALILTLEKDFPPENGAE